MGGVVDSIFGGGGGGGGSAATGSTAPTSQNITTSNIAPWAQPGVTNLINAGMGQVFATNPDGSINFNSMKGYTPFNANTPAGNEWVQGAAGSVAGFSPLQQQAQQNIANMQVPGQYGQAMGMSTLSGLGSLGTTQQAMGYGQTGLGAGLAGMQQGMSYGQNATDPNAVAAYMNPYLQNALNPALQLQNQQFGQINAQNQGQATQQGAFGGGRQAVMQGLNQQNQMLAQNQLVGGAYNQAYNTANQNMQAASQLGMQGAGLGISGANAGLAGVGAQQAGYGQLGAQGTNLANIAGAQTQQGLNINAAQAAAGATQQQNQQNILNQAMANYNTAQTYPMTQLAQLESLYTGAPQNVTSSTYSAAPSTTSQLAGLGTAAIGAAKLMGKEGGLPEEFEVKKFKEGKRVKEDDTQEWLDMLNFSANAPSAKYVEGLGMQSPPPMVNGRVGANVDALGGNVRAGLSGTAMMTPDKRIVTKPGAVDVGYRTAQNSEYDPYLDMNAYRSINAIPGKGYAQGVNAKYTIPFVSGGIASGVPAPKLDAMLGRLDDRQLAMKADPRTNDPQTAQAALSQEAFRQQMRPAGIGSMYNYNGAGGGIVAFAGDTDGSLVKGKDDSSDIKSILMQEYKTPIEEQIARNKALMPSTDFATKYGDILGKVGYDFEADKKQAQGLRLLQAGLGIMGGTSPFAAANIGQGSQAALAGYGEDIKGLKQQQMDLAKQQFELGKFGYSTDADLVKAAHADRKSVLADLTKIYGSEKEAEARLKAAEVSAAGTVTAAGISAEKAGAKERQGIKVVFDSLVAQGYDPKSPITMDMAQEKYLAQTRPYGAAPMMSALSGEIYKDPQIKALSTQLMIAQNGGDAKEVETIQAKIAARTKEIQANFKDTAASFKPGASNPVVTTPVPPPAPAKPALNGTIKQNPDGTFDYVPNPQ
jgi:hypothetical protein